MSEYRTCNVPIPDIAGQVECWIGRNGAADDVRRLARNVVMRTPWMPTAIGSHRRNRSQRRCWSRARRTQQARTHAPRKRLATSAAALKRPHCIASCASIARRCSPMPPRAAHRVVAIRDSSSRNSTNMNAAAFLRTAWSASIARPAAKAMSWRFHAKAARSVCRAPGAAWPMSPRISSTLCSQWRAIGNGR